MASNGTPTPKKVSDLATEKADLSSTALIGIFGSDSTPGALIREGGGQPPRQSGAAPAAGLKPWGRRGARLLTCRAGQCTSRA